MVFFSPESHFKAGDLVWIIEANSSKGHCPLARVKSLNYGNDGRMPSAVKRPATGEYTPPILKLAPVIAPLVAEDVSAGNYASVI